MRDPAVSLNASSEAAKVDGPPVPPPDDLLLIRSIVGIINPFNNFRRQE